MDRKTSVWIFPNFFLLDICYSLVESWCFKLLLVKNFIIQQERLRKIMMPLYQEKVGKHDILIQEYSYTACWKNLSPASGSVFHPNVPPSVRALGLRRPTETWELINQNDGLNGWTQKKHQKTWLSHQVGVVTIATWVNYGQLVNLELILARSPCLWVAAEPSNLFQLSTDGSSNVP